MIASPMPIPKAELKRRKRKERRDAGLVEFRAYGTPSWKLELKAIAEALKGSEADLNKGE